MFARIYAINMENQSTVKKLSYVSFTLFII